jgi:hypothetical protein
MSELMIVFRRWAIVITVESAKSSLISLMILASVTKSIFAVASSKITTLAFRMLALQMQISYFSPVDRFLPPSSIMNSQSGLSSLF